MGFDINTATEYLPETNQISTNSFNPMTAQDAPETIAKGGEPGVVAKVLRGIFKGSVLEQMQTQSFLLDRIDDGTLPNEPGKSPEESTADFESRFGIWNERANAVMKDREKEIENEGILRQIEAPLTVVIGKQVAIKPLVTSGFIAGFSILDRIFNARLYLEDKHPDATGNMKDLVEVIDFIAKGALLGGGMIKTKNVLNKRLNGVKVPASVKISPKQIEAIKTSTILNSKEKVEMLRDLGIEQKHVDIATNNNVPIKIPSDKILDLSNKPNWVKTKEILVKESAPKVKKGILEDLPPEVQEQVKPIIDALPPEIKSEILPLIEGTGEAKVRTLAQGVQEKAVEKGLTEGFGDLPEFKAVSMAEQAVKATDLLTSDPQFAIDIAMGRKNAPKGVIPEAVFVAVEDQAVIEGNVNLIRDLAIQSRLTAEATTMGQRIRTLGERDPESPVGAIQQVKQAREVKAKRKTTKKKVKNDVTAMKESIKKEAPKLSQWESFIKQLEC